MVAGCLVAKDVTQRITLTLDTPPLVEIWAITSLVPFWDTGVFDTLDKSSQCPPKLTQSEGCSVEASPIVLPGFDSCSLQGLWRRPPAQHSSNSGTAKRRKTDLLGPLKQNTPQLGTFATSQVPSTPVHHRAERPQPSAGHGFPELP